ncbi:MAG: DUF1385 domain-containing protein [Capsulimonadales bacterium]|nr:DUF1385 domain-containing protein [Capsulimonadales bacterium]
MSAQEPPPPDTHSPPPDSRSRTPSSPPATFYGGQAVIEGVMMRGPRHFAVACRRANGEIVVTCETVPPILRPNWQKWPFLRGVFSLVDAMTLGTKSLFWSAKVAESDIPSAGKAQESAAAALPGNIPGPPPATGSENSRSSRVTDIAIGGAMVTGLLFALVLIVVVPNLILEFAKSRGVTERWQLGGIDGLVRITVFVSYILLISRMHYIRRVFQYHGAEHKAINVLEAGKPLNVFSAQEASRLHPRCGTAFVFIVLILTTIAFAPFYGLPPLIRIPVHLLVMLPVAGVAFELLRLAGKYRNNPFAAVLSTPGMWAQLLTTREPDESQLEVSLASLRAVMDAERAEKGEPPSAPPASAVA